jgi:hypothetical protein
MALMRSFVHIRGAAGPVRLETFEGREHVVLPVVALVEGVIHASNAEFPELVLAEEFGKVPQGWDGRPAMLDHPEVGGEKTSANEPSVLERFKLGQVFHARVEGKKLLMEAYLDPARADVVGEEARALLDRARGGQIVEVSVGVFVSSEEKSGEFNGQRFMSIWRDIVPDHLALLPEGKIGACSVEMGCGTPRAAAGREKTMTKSLKERFAELMERFRPAAMDDGTSDADLRSRLEQALFATEPGYLGVLEVFPENTAVVYATAPEGEVRYFRRTYAIDGEGAVALADDAEEVRQVTRYEPVATPTAASAHVCGCGARSATTAPAKKEELSMEKKARIAALVESGKQCFTAAQLEAFTDEALATLEAHVKAATDVPAPAPPPAPEVEAIKATTPTPEEEIAAFMASHPDIAEAVKQSQIAAASRRTVLVGKLVAAQKAFTEADLQAMPIEQLEKLAGAVVREKVDFAPAAPRAADGADVIPAPPSMRDAILQMRGTPKSA